MKINWNASKFLSLFFWFGCYAAPSFLQGCRGEAFPNQDLPVPAKNVTALKYSLDGAKLAGVDDAGNVFVLDTSTGKVISQWVLPYSAEELKDKILDVAVKFSDDGASVYACVDFSVNRNCEVSGWDLSNPNPKTPLFLSLFNNLCGDGLVGDTMISLGNGTAETGYSTVSIRNIKTDQELFTIPHTNVTSASGWKSPYVILYKFVDNDHSYSEVWDIQARKKIFEQSKDQPKIELYGAVPEKNLLLFSNVAAAGSTSLGDLLLWDTKANHAIQRFQLPAALGDSLISASLSDDGSRVLAAGHVYQNQQTWLLWEVASSEPKVSKTIELSELGYPGFISFLPSHHNQILIHYKGWGITKLWDVDEDKLLETFSIYVPMSHVVSSLRWFVVSADGTRLASPSHTEGQILTWDL